MSLAFGQAARDAGIARSMRSKGDGYDFRQMTRRSTRKRSPATSTSVSARVHSCYSRIAQAGTPRRH